MSAAPEMTNLFQFMELRAPFSPEEKALRQKYIRDDYVVIHNDKPDRIETDLQSTESPSVIGRLVYQQVFFPEEAGNAEESHINLINALLRILTPYQLLGPDSETTETKEIKPLSILELERRSHLQKDGLYYLLPERLEQIEELMLFPELLLAFEAMDGARRDFNLSKLVKKLEAIFGGRTLREVVFQNGVYADDFRMAKRSLFDTLYLLYIFRRHMPVNLEYVIEGLRVLHVVEALALDNGTNTTKVRSLSTTDKLLRTTMEVFCPKLKERNGSDKLEILPLIQKEDDFAAYFTATPVIHPIFARLHRYKNPFNDLKPIGIGDLKVVKQWLIAYQLGEIAHIENVLKGENKKRTHRRLEKTDESFSFSSDSKEESSKDTQSTTRLDLKTEVENTVQTSLNVGADAKLTYDNKIINATISANFSYKRDTTERSKTSQEFSQDIITKAIERVEKNVSEKRAITKVFETEETNEHGFDNKEGKGHVTGIYRWLDKKYKAQLYNYGTRMMFEFIIPEPAAFFVESRLRAFEATVDCPQPPKPPTLKNVSLPFALSDITDIAVNKTDITFQELRQKYDLSQFSFPETKKTVPFINPETGQAFFREKDFEGEDIWYAKSYKCDLKSKGYKITRLFLDGDIYWRDKNNSKWRDNSVFILSVNGTALFIGAFGGEDYKSYLTPNENYVDNPEDIRLNQQFTPYLLTTDEVNLVLGFQDAKRFDLIISAELTIDQALNEWRTQVFNKVKAIEQQRVDKENQELLLAYNSQMATYRNRLAELKATSVNDLLQGQPEAFNREFIRTELKKHCLTLLTKELDADSSDDLIAKIDPIKGHSEQDNFIYRRFKVTEASKGTENSKGTEDSTKNSASCSFEIMKETIDYPSIVLEEAKKKGRFIQFLEQAFEWQQLAYIFYPYFWAQQPDWIQMMSRADAADPNMTAFLQSGSAKVLLAVTPHYQDAVLHFLATREPWEGGPAPVIGDPLFIPLHEELRKRQDDLYNANAEGDPWTFTLPTSLVYLDGGGATLPTFPDITTP